LLPKEVRELLIVKFGIAIGIDSSDDSHELSLGSVVTVLLEEETDIVGGKLSIGVVVKGLEDGIG